MLIATVQLAIIINNQESVTFILLLIHFICCFLWNLSGLHSGIPQLEDFLFFLVDGQKLYPVKIDIMVEFRLNF